ncbi:MAG: 2-hydroxyacid dehydrogenase [Candidatus Aminicenantia bacterium]
MRFKVLLTRKIIKEAMDYLSSITDLEVGSDDVMDREILLEKIKDKDGLISMLDDRIDKEIMDSAPKLKVISNYAVGYNNIDVKYAISKGIFVTNTPGVLTETTADLTLALILSTCRQIPQADDFTRRGEFKGWGPTLFLGRDVYGKTLGIIGFGRIGRSVARRATGFNMKILYWDKIKLKKDEEMRLNVEFRELEPLLQESDIITVHLPLTTETHHLLNRERLSLLKEDSVLINTARGPIIDEKTLCDFLEEGRIWGAGLDVYEREPEIEKRLFNHPRVVLLPHIGSASFETRKKMGMLVAEGLLKALRGEIPDNLVDEWKEELKKKI